MIVVVTAVSINASLAREEDRKRLERMNVLLNATLVNMPHGVCMFDADKKHLHGIAARELNRHIQKNGLVLTDDQINVLRAMEQAISPNRVRCMNPILHGRVP